MRSMELPAGLRDRNLRGYKNNSAALKVPKSPVASITRTLPGAGCSSKLSNQGRRALVREVTENQMVTLAELL